MLDRPHVTELQFREWQHDRWGDLVFKARIPAVKWDCFAQKLRPLADDCAARVRERLFAGVRGRLPLQGGGRVDRGKSSDTSCPARLAAPRDLIGSGADEGVRAGRPRTVLRCSPRSRGSVYVTGWPDLLDLLRRGWLTELDTFVLCAEGTRADRTVLGKHLVLFRKTRQAEPNRTRYFKRGGIRRTVPSGAEQSEQSCATSGHRGRRCRRFEPPGDLPQSATHAGALPEFVL